jgi:Tol biopolymer transport system component
VERRRLWSPLLVLVAAASLAMVGCASTEQKPKAGPSTWKGVTFVGQVAASSAVGRILPGFGKTNGKIAFTSDRGGSKQIWVMNADGSNQVQLTSAFVDAENPSWSRDGTKIAFIGTNHMTNSAILISQVYVMNADGSGQRPVTNVQFSGSTFPFIQGFTPAWSPDGKMIVFMAGERVPVDSTGGWVINTDGSGQRSLSRSIFNADWSPDGASLVHDRNGTGISITSAPFVSFGGADTTSSVTTKVLTTRPGDRNASWSPDGSKIAFNRSPLGDGSAPEVFVMGADGSALTNVTNSTTAEFLPEWAPDGTKIAFHSDPRINNLDIYVMNADGTGRTRLTTDAGLDIQPSWQPRTRWLFEESRPLQGGSLLDKPTFGEKFNSTLGK